jgi:hypothetical protein
VFRKEIVKMNRSIHFVMMVAAVLVLAGGVSVSRADSLFSTDFESLSVGTIDGQDSWVSTADSGQIVDLGGTHGMVLDVLSGPYWDQSDTVRDYTPGTNRYALVEMDFQIVSEGKYYWFNDNDSFDPNISIHGMQWESSWTGDLDANQVWSNAPPGLPRSERLHVTVGTWYHFGIVVDQNSPSHIVYVNQDGTWKLEDSNDDISLAGQLSRFIIRGGAGDDTTGHLYIDNLSISDSDALIPEPATLTLLAFGAGALLLRRRRVA